MKDQMFRQSRRHRFQASAHAIAVGWEKAWYISKAGQRPDIGHQLRELVALGQAQHNAFETTSMQLGGIALTVMRLGGIASALKLPVRHGLRGQ